MSERRKYYTAIALFLSILLIVNIRTHLPYPTMDKNISMMYIKIAEKCSKAKMYEASNFYYKIAMKVSKKTVWLDYNIGKNIVSECWDMPEGNYKNKKLEEAIYRLSIDLEKHPQHPSILAQMGHAYYLKEDYKKAIEYYELTLRESPNWSYGFQQIARCYRLLGDDKKSIEFFDKYLAANPKSIYNTSIELGSLYTNIKEYNNAIKLYTQAANSNPNDISAWVNLSYVSELYLEDYESAIKYADKALEINKYNQAANSNKAYALICLGKYDEALPYTKYNLTKNGGGRSYFQMGLINFGKGNKEEAKRYLTEALSIEQNDPIHDSQIIIDKINNILKQCE